MIFKFLTTKTADGQIVPICPTRHPGWGVPRLVCVNVVKNKIAIAITPLPKSKILSSNPQWNSFFSRNHYADNDTYIVGNESHCHFSTASIPLTRM